MHDPELLKRSPNLVRSCMILHDLKFISTARFPGSSSLELGSLNDSWAVPFPRLHYPLISFASLSTLEEHEGEPVAKLTNACFELPSRMVTCNPEEGKYLSACALYRGDIDEKIMRDSISKARTKYTVDFSDWISGYFKTSIAQPSPHFLNPTADLCVISHNTAISNVWKSLTTKFDLMWSKRAFTHWYRGEMPWGEMWEARDNLRMLELDYSEVSKNKPNAGDETGGEY
ncbi:Tubulin/FtsZ [Flagelloscypha sp. PMI_526]|nr:Tubulin/FtsZ [Flagelloscypha sp. PMI_526]